MWPALDRNQVSSITTTFDCCIRAYQVQQSHQRHLLPVGDWCNLYVQDELQLCDRLLTLSLSVLHQQHPANHMVSPPVRLRLITLSGSSYSKRNWAGEAAASYSLSNTSLTGSRWAPSHANVSRLETT